MQPFYSERLYYRPFRRSDAPAVFAIFGDAEVMKFSGFGPHADVRRTEVELAGFIAHNRRHGFGRWAVIERDTSELIGVAGLSELDPEGKEVHLAYRLRRDRWGRGYASEAARAWLEKGFTALGLPRIVAVVEPANVVSRHILEKLGLRHVEQRRRHGKLVDVLALGRRSQV